MRGAISIWLVLTAGAAAAECPPQAEETAARLAAAWEARETVAAPDVADDAAARCVQDALVARLEAQAGAPAGWKVGLTSPGAQEAFGVDHPLAGRLLAGMLLDDGASVPRDFGGRGVVEADLIVTVRDAGLMQAGTPLEVLEHLESLVPFIELADLMVAPGEPMTADVITAINVGARAGVTGAPVPVAATEEFLTALGTMTVRIEDAEGVEIGAFPGAAILGHPVNAVLWLTGRLKATGRSLNPGDRISLGSFGPPMPVEDRDGLRVTYEGLPVEADPTVAVRFE